MLARQKEKPHVLNQARLSVSIYQAFLESNEGDVPVDSDWTRGQKLHIAVDPDVMEFITTSAFQDQLNNSLAAKKCKITWKPNTKMAVIVYQGADSSDSWQSECFDDLQNFLGKFAKHDVQVNKDSWRAVVEKLSSMRARLGVDPPLVRLIEDSFVARIVSLSTAVTDYEERLRSILEEIYREEIRKTYLKKKLSNVTKERLILLEKIKFVEELQETNKELEIKLDPEGEELYFEGPESQFTEATTKYFNQMLCMVEKHLALSDIILEVLGSEEGLKKVQSELENNDVQAVFVMDNGSGARIVSTSAAHWDKAEWLVNRLALNEKVQVNDKSECLLKTPEWRELCDEINNETAVRFHRDNLDDIVVAGFQDEVKEVMKKLNTFLENNCIKEEQYVCSSAISRKHLHEFCQDDLRCVENQLKDFEVKIEKGKGDDDFEISGNRNSLIDVRRELLALEEDAVSKHFDVKQPGLWRYFESGKGDRLVKLVEKDQNCAIQVQGRFFGQSLDGYDEYEDGDGDGDNDGFGDGDGDDAAADGGAVAAAGGVIAADGGATTTKGGGGVVAYAAVAGAAANGYDDNGYDDDDGDDGYDDDDDDDVDDDDEQDDDGDGSRGGNGYDNEDEDADSGTDPSTLVMTKDRHKISWRTGLIETETVSVQFLILCSTISVLFLISRIPLVY